MINDKSLTFCTDQAVTASAASADYLDLLVARDIGIGEPVEIFVRVTESFATLTSLNVGIQCDDSSGFSTPKNVCTSGAIAQAALTAGTFIPIGPIPVGCNERYVRLYFTVSGSNATAGKITAGIVRNKPANSAITA